MGDGSGSATRRAAVVGLCTAVAGAAVPALAQTPAPAATRFGGVRVDTAPLAARGAPGAAGLIQRIMPGKLAQVFADLLGGDRTAPVLVARIDVLYLSAFADAVPPGLSTQALDYLDGAGLVVLARQAQTSTPLHVVLPASYSGSWYLPDIDARRIDSLCYQFAYWLRREMQV